MREPQGFWVGRDASGGVPSQVRKDLEPPPAWRIGWVAATRRPRDPAISPDGDKVAFILDDDASDIWVAALDGGTPVRMTTHRDPAPYWEDTNVVWSPDGRWLAYTDRGHVEVAPAGGGTHVRLVEGHGAVWLDADRLVVSVVRSGRTRLAVVDIHDPWPGPLTAGEGEPGSVSTDGATVVYVNAPPDDRKRREVHVVDLASGIDKAVTGTPGMADFAAEIGPDGATIAFVSERTGWNEIHLIGVDGGGERQLTDAEANFSELTWRADGSRLVAIRTRHGVADLVTVDTTTGDVELTARGGTWSSPAWLPDGRIVACHESHSVAPRLVVVGEGGAVTPIVDGAPASVAAAPYVTPEHVWFPSRDGVQIPGFLFRPPLADAGPVAAVVYPHGGPTSYYGDEWDGYAQYFLDKGYAWLAVNYRGSTTYGRDLERADHGEWGVTDTGDCLAAADYLAGLDWVDGDRIAIFGASYGSYMALSCLVTDPTRFACAIAKYGDSDILTSWAQGDAGGSDDLERMMDHPGRAPLAYREGSPIHSVENVVRPILVAHGEQDERVNPKQSQQLVDALESLGKQYEYITYPTEGHGLLRRGPQVHFYERMERFLDWHLLGPPETSHVGPPPKGA